MAKDGNCLIVALALCSLFSVTAFANPAWNPAGFWVGHLNYLDADLPVQLDIRKKTGGWEASLDIPSLVYADQLINMEESDAGFFTLEFPFGIGALGLRPDGAGGLRGNRDSFSLALTLAVRPKTQQTEIHFGAIEPKLSGTLYLPDGDGPFPVAVLIAGSGNASRNNWSYSSWVDFYLEIGIGAFIYDRRADDSPLPDGSVAVIDDHARDLADAIRILRSFESVDTDRIGLVGFSRGAWIAMAVNDHVPGLAFILLSSVAAATPAEQEVSSVLTGMDQDGLASTQIDAARSYLRLYFYVAQTSKGWGLLESAIMDGARSDWLQYVDQPKSLEDLRWWRANMNFDAIAHLRRIQTPVLAIWGGADFITPWTEYHEKLVATLKAGGNADVTTRIFENADHRIEIGFGEGAEGNWHWFGIAPGALDMTGEWLERVLQKKPLISPGNAGSNAARGHSSRDTSRQTSFEGEVPHK